MTLSSSIDIGMSGLNGFSQELQTISDNVANLNTPGFKGSAAQFADLFYQDNSASGGSGASVGNGMQVLPSVVNFSKGPQTQTGVSTNLAVNGNSFFVTKDPKTGQIAYTQDGQFQFDNKGYLVDSTGTTRVQALTGSGTLQDLTINGLQNSMPKASSTITLSGNLSSTGTTPVVQNAIKVIDAAGGSHTLTATFTNSTTSPGTWTVAVTDGSTPVGSGTITFSNGTLVAGKNTVSLTYSPAGVPAIPLTLTMDMNTTTYLAQASSLSIETVDGYGAGTISNESFDQTGTLILTYTNGQTVNGPVVALANFNSTQSLQHAGNNAFVTANNSDAQLGTAGATSAWGTITSGAIEGSNVNLSTEFSNIIITQRGYQAASELISTANQMMQDVLSMKGQGA